MRIGYACLNTTLAEKDVQVNRSMIRKTFIAKGVAYASELALRNVGDLEKVIDWNIRYKIMLYRLSSDMFPWMSEYELLDLPDYKAIADTLTRVGRKALNADMRLTFHPGPFNVLATASPVVLRNTVKELRQHGEIMDLLGLPRSPFAKINIHVGGAYGNRQMAMERFCDHLGLLPESAATRLTVENDDKASMFSIADLMFIHVRTGVPLVFDYLHHKFCTGGLAEEEAFRMAVSTWPAGINPVVHFSSSKKIYEDPTAAEAAHADMIHEPVNTYGRSVDVMLEAKAKEVALKAFRRKFARQFSAPVGA